MVTPTGNPAGKATLTTVQAGVEIFVEAQGLTPGSHGLHVHANGACAPGPDPATGQIVSFGAAGGHFDPGVSHNHGQPGQPMAEVHGGDIRSLQVGPDGKASLRFISQELTVAPGRASVMGRTIVVHADPDDYVSDPAGNSGARLLCGVLGPSAPGLVKARTTLEGSQVFPEGIALDARSGAAYVGSSATGDIFRIPKGAEKAELFQAGGSPGRQGAFGMKVDEQGRLWVAGGPSGTLALVDGAGGGTLAVWKAPASRLSFLNDVVLSRGYVYITDSFNPVIYRVRNAPGGAAPLEPWLDLSNTAVRYVPNEVNMNGIVASEDGRYLLTIQMVTGQLWRIDTQTRAVAEVRIEGADLKNGDGLVLLDPTSLYVVRNASNEIARVRLDPTWSTGRIEQRLTDPRLHYPTTAAAIPGGLMVVNGQLDKQKTPPPLLPFDVVTIAPGP
ncbi:superoxide dismutase family protein [Variovorax sp. J22P271]|nr:superoxide dismutase family protein [Variovorax sp. J22P271]